MIGRLGESSLHTDDGEDAKPSKGIHHQHSQIIGTLMLGQQPLHGWKKHDGGCEQCRCSIDGIPKGGRGLMPRGDPGLRAAYGSDEAENHDSKDVHVLFMATMARIRRRRWYPPLQNDDKFIQRSVFFFV